MVYRSKLHHLSLNLCVRQLCRFPKLVNHLEYKICVLGELSVGKTTAIRYFVRNAKYSHVHEIEIQSDVYHKRVDVETPKKMMADLHIWDYAGSEMTMPSNLWMKFLHEVSGVIIMFSCNDRSSFDDVPVLFRILGTALDYQPPMILVANKMDLSNEVPKEEVLDFAEKYDIPCFFTNALTGENIEDVFVAISSECHRDSPFRSMIPDRW